MFLFKHSSVWPLEKEWELLGNVANETRTARG